MFIGKKFSRKVKSSEINPHSCLEKRRSSVCKEGKNKGGEKKRKNFLHTTRAGSMQRMQKNVKSSNLAVKY